jgi:ATP-dependent RNA helicase DeaD
VRVSAPVLRALTEIGYSAPTPIQERIIQPMLDGHDVVGQAQTGTGKTAGFGIPIAEMVDGGEQRVQAIVLVPTRELAVQVTGELDRISKHRGIRVVTLYGGQPINRQLDALARGVHVVVGTPGRVIDHLERRTLRIDQVRIAVLDEADQMLDIGFFPDIRRILRMTPKSRQTALFSATVPFTIHRLIRSYLREPQWVRIGEEAVPVAEVRQMYCEVAGSEKMDALMELLDYWGPGQTLVFRRTQMGIDRIVPALRRKGYSVRGIHGGMAQTERNAALQEFRDGKLRVLIATNVASRGLDIPSVEHVVNYDIPDNVEEYIHRIGRTARMGREGLAMTFVGEWDLREFDTLIAHLGADSLERHEAAIYKVAPRQG